MRYAFKENGKVATFEEFLDLVDKRKVKPNSFFKLQVGSKKTEPFPEGPPCLNVMALNGIGEGSRNMSLFNYGAMNYVTRLYKVSTICIGVQHSYDIFLKK